MLPKPRASLTSASKPASTCSTPPTATPTAVRKKCWPRRSAAGAIALLISTKAFFPTGEGPNDRGSSRYHLRRALEDSLRRLNTDYIDIYHLHGFDALTPIEEVQDTLNTFVREGKVRYIACSNFSGWHLMKSLAIADRYGWTRFVGHQVYYSLVGREYEWELMPLAIDEKVGALVWSPLGWGRLTGKIRRGQPLPEVSRLHKTADAGPPVPDEYLYTVVDALDAIAKETGKTVPQIALNWLLQRPTVSLGHRWRAQRKATARQSRSRRTGPSPPSRSPASTRPAPSRPSIRTGSTGKLRRTESAARVESRTEEARDRDENPGLQNRDLGTHATRAMDGASDSLVPLVPWSLVFSLLPQHPHRLHARGAHGGRQRGDSGHQQNEHHDAGISGRVDGGDPVQHAGKEAA